MLLPTKNLIAQAIKDSTICEQQQIGDFLFPKKNVPLGLNVPIVGKLITIIVPVISSAPATGVSVGAAAQVAVFMGPPTSTRISQTSANITYTTKDQFLINVKSFLITSYNKFILQGDWRYYDFSQSTYGLGTNAPADLEVAPNNIWQNDISSGEQPMLFNYIKFHETISGKIFTNGYLGLGYHLDYHYKILDKNLADSSLTSHLAYSVYHGFNPKKYTLSGMSLNFTYDSRDNQLNTYKGFYANFQYRYNPEFLRSAANSSLVWIEVRAFKNLSKNKPRHLVGLWSFANIVASGKVPYLDLPAYGYDTRNRSARTFIQGRYRGEDMLYSELEYRFPISRCSQILGGVFFVNATTLSNRSGEIKLFDYIRPGVGTGLRIMVDKLSRTNLGIDIGFSKNYYGITLAATETF